LPSAVLLFPTVFSNDACVPTAVLPVPVVLRINVAYPNAVNAVPLRLPFNPRYPTTVLRYSGVGPTPTLTLLIVASALTVNPVNVPTLVKLLLTTLAANVVPVNVFAAATDAVAA
jgi:hypothetical protein